MNWMNFMFDNNTNIRWCSSMHSAKNESDPSSSSRLQCLPKNRREYTSKRDTLFLRFQSHFIAMIIHIYIFGWTSFYFSFCCTSAARLFVRWMNDTTCEVVRNAGINLSGIQNREFICHHHRFLSCVFLGLHRRNCLRRSGEKMNSVWTARFRSWCTDEHSSGSHWQRSVPYTKCEDQNI